MDGQMQVTCLLVPGIVSGISLRLLASNELSFWTGFHIFYPLGSVSSQIFFREGISSKHLSLGGMWQSENLRTFCYQNLFTVWRHFENVYDDLLHFSMKSLSWVIQ